MLLGSAYGKVTLDTNGVTNGVRQAKADLQSLAAVGEKVGQAMQKAGQMMTIGLTLPILAAGAAGIKMASDLEETKSKVGVIFGDMSKDMLDWAETANTALGQTRQQALDASAPFALFGIQAGKSGQDLNEFAKQNVQFAADFASFYNPNPEDAITAIGAAYRGETEPIRRYNILLNDQIIKQKAVNMGLYDGNGQLSQQARILAVNALIAEQGSAAMGDFARTSGGLANQTRILNAQFQDSLALLGQNLLPIALEVTKGLNAMLIAFQKLPPSAQKGVLVFLMFLAVLGPLISGIGTLITTVTSLIGIWPTLTAGASTLGIVLPSLSAGFAGIGAVITGTVLPALGAFLVAAAPIILTIGLVIAAVGLLYWAFSTNFNGITDTVKMLGFIIEFYAKKYWNDLVNGAASGIRRFGDYVKRGVQNVVAVFRIDWAAIGRNMITGIINGINASLAALVAAAKRSAAAALTAFKNALGIHSPSTKFEWAGKMSALGYIQGISNIDPAAMAASIARPTQSFTRMATQTNTYQFQNGLSLREARKMSMQAEEAAYRRTKKMLGV